MFIIELRFKSLSFEKYNSISNMFSLKQLLCLHCQPEFLFKYINIVSLL
jgi:hypothetical protein